MTMQGKWRIDNKIIIFPTFCFQGSSSLGYSDDYSGFDSGIFIINIIIIIAIIIIIIVIIIITIVFIVFNFYYYY